MKCTLTGETSNASQNETLQIQEAVQENSEPYAQTQYGETRAARRHRSLVHISVVLASLALGGCQTQRLQFMDHQINLAETYTRLYHAPPCDSAGNEDWYPFETKQEFAKWLARHPSQLNATPAPRPD